MAYQALARRYRPRTFEEVLGQSETTRTLANAIRLGRIAPAYLFSGPRGIGKTTVARIFARALNCEKGPTPTPCGECSACREILEGSSLDVMEVDGASSTSVDDVRALRERVQYAPVRGRYRVFIVDEVHMLSTAAFNALLKTLEEPPAHAVFIFATTEPQEIPATVLSRCQRFQFRRLTRKEIFESLKEVAGREKAHPQEGALALLAAAAQGSLRDGQSLLDQMLSYGGPDFTEPLTREALGALDPALLWGLVEAALAGEAAQALERLGTIYTRGYNLQSVAEEVLGVLRDLLVARVTGGNPELLDLTEEETARTVGVASGQSPEDLLRRWKVWAAATAEAPRSPAPRAVLEAGLVRLALIRPLPSVADLIDRLGALERALGGSGDEILTPRESAPHTAVGRPAAPPSLPPSPPPSPPRAAESSRIGAGSAAATPEGDPWTALLTSIERKREGVAAFLKEARPLKFEKGLIELGVPEDSLVLDQIRSAETVALLAEAGSEIWGAPPRVQVTVVPPSGRRPVSPEAEEKERLSGHPAVRATLEAFGGEIASVRPARRRPTSP